MFRRKATIISLAFAAVTLAACGRSPTAPVLAPPAGVQPSVQASTASVMAGQQQRGSAMVTSGQRGRSKYSVIFF
jgi:uncharacterized lipoprotein YajG